MRFSQEELKHIFRAWLVISLAFAFFLYPGNLFTFEFLTSSLFYINFVIAAITVGLGFLLHELAHKFVAQRYGCIAEFRAFDNMLVLALIMAFVLRFIFAAPGAVMIHGRVNVARNGRISAVGPLMNIVLAALFFVADIIISVAYPQELLLRITSYGVSINGWLALFNLIPIWELDGRKVLTWNKKVYGTLVAIAFVCAFILPALLI